MPFQSTAVYDRNGTEIHERWRQQGAPSAYAGMMTTDMPNFYMTTGPNTLSGHYSVTTIIEIQAQYIAQLVRYQLQHDVQSFEVTKPAFDNYNKMIKELMQGRVWTSAACNSWFKTKDGLIPTNFPGTTMLYWSKVYYPNMKHIKQIGGTKKINGTSIEQEVTKASFGLTSVIVLLILYQRNSPMIKSNVGSLFRGIVGVARDLLAQAKWRLGSA